MKLSFVHVVDQIQFEPVTAQLAAIARREGWEVSSVLTDYGTGKESFTAALFGQKPNALAIRVTGETREVIAYIAAMIREARPDLPMLFFGPLCQTHPENVSGIVDPSAILFGEPHVAFRELVRALGTGRQPTSSPAGVWFFAGGRLDKGPPALPFDPNDAPMPELEVFGGEDLLKCGMGCSFFGEIGRAPVECSVGTPSGPAYAAGLQPFGAFTDLKPRLRPAALILDWIAEWAPRMRHLEFHDREFGWNAPFASHLLEELARRLPDLGYTVRFLAGTMDDAVLDSLDPSRCRRIVFEYDAATTEAAGRLPGTTDPALLSIALRKARSRGFEVGLLVSVGLPYESSASIQAKLDFIRAEGVARVRFLPFEPRFASTLYTLCSVLKILPVGPEGWNREVYRPLVQSSLPVEEWHLSWQHCLDLQARLQLAHPTPPARVGR